jgi:hypothetical protein
MGAFMVPALTMTRRPFAEGFYRFEQSAVNALGNRVGYNMLSTPIERSLADLRRGVGKRHSSPCEKSWNPLGVSARLERTSRRKHCGRLLLVYKKDSGAQKKPNLIGLRDPLSGGGRVACRPVHR